MLIGYARVSTDDQDTAAQVAALKVAGCERIYREKASGGRWDRPELQRLLDQLRKGDVLVVWKLDRLSRSLRDLIVIMERFAAAKAGFRSLTEVIDTATPAGRMMIQMVGAFAEFERAMPKSEPRRDWMLPARTAALVDVGQNYRLSSNPRSEGWFQRVARPQPTPHDCSKFISPSSRVFWRGSHAPRLHVPNSSENDISRAQTPSRCYLCVTY
jgi:hypothetical protein